MKPCTSDHVRAIAAAWSSDSASSASPVSFSLRIRTHRVRQSFERGRRRLVERRPGHVEPLGTEHQPVHAGARLRIGDVCLGARQGLHQRMRFGPAGGCHGLVEAPESDGGKFAQQPGEIAEMMGRRGMRHAGLARHRPQGQARQARRAPAPARRRRARRRADRRDDRGFRRMDGDAGWPAFPLRVSPACALRRDGSFWSLAMFLPCDSL